MGLEMSAIYRFLMAERFCDDAYEIEKKENFF